MRPQIRNIWTGLLAILIAALSLALFDGITAALSCVLGWCMLAIAIIDAEHMIIPDFLSLPAIPAGLAAVWFLPADIAPNLAVLGHLGAAIIGALALYAIRALYLKTRHREGLGLGDVKLAAVAGAWTGVAGISYVLILACGSALVYAAALRIREPNMVGWSSVIPFGAFLAPSIWAVWTFVQLSQPVGGPIL